MMKRLLLLGILLLCAILPARGDDQVRQVQEELRKRNLYFGDINGQASDDLVNALKRYQTRKGFPVTGAVDEVTATSLNIRSQMLATASSAKAGWPDMPILKSDSARELSAAERQELAQQAEENLDRVTPSPAPPAEEPPLSQALSRQQVNAFVEQYLRDAEQADIPAQTRYFGYPVEYFDHGRVGPEFVEKDVVNYCKRWPERKYMLTDPVTFAAAEAEGETLIEFPTAFSVRNKKHAVDGRTKNIWRVRSEGDQLKIVAIREERLRD